MKNVNASLTVVAALLAVTLRTVPTQANVILSLPASASPSGFWWSGTPVVDAGNYAGGTELNIQVSGEANLDDPGPTGPYLTYPDGSLAQFQPVNGGYSYANPGAQYPTVAGGDGINHFVGGGLNYDISSAPQLYSSGFAGLETTDTTNPGCIRFGEAVGTFFSDPTRTDWFAIGLGVSVVVPQDGADLYLAVNEGCSNNDTGAYSVKITVPEPGTLTLLVSALLGLAGVVHLRRRGAKA